jgi:hypothetical protein
MSLASGRVYIFLVTIENKQAEIASEVSRCRNLSEVLWLLRWLWLSFQLRLTRSIAGTGAGTEVVEVEVGVGVDLLPARRSAGCSLHLTIMGMAALTTIQAPATTTGLFQRKLWPTA